MGSTGQSSAGSTWVCPGGCSHLVAHLGWDSPCWINSWVSVEALFLHSGSHQAALPYSFSSCWLPVFASSLRPLIPRVMMTSSHCLYLIFHKVSLAFLNRLLSPWFSFTPSELSHHASCLTLSDSGIHKHKNPLVIKVHIPQGNTFKPWNPNVWEKTGFVCSVCIFLLLSPFCGLCEWFMCHFFSFRSPLDGSSLFPLTQWGWLLDSLLIPGEATLSL